MFRLWNYIFGQNNDDLQSDVNQEETEDEEPDVYQKKSSNTEDEEPDVNQKESSNTEDEEPDDQEGSSSDEEESVDKTQEGVSDILCVCLKGGK